MTEANQEEFVDLVVAQRIAGRIAEQFRAFMEGLGDMLPLDLLRMFDKHELELLICGMTEIGTDDWTTDYRGYEKTDQVIEWFWACLRSWPAERKKRLLQFTTGTSRVPVNAFKDLQGSDGPRCFTIGKSGDPNDLPRSHTCFNRLDLPPFEDYESLERNLRFAIERISFISSLVAFSCSSSHFRSYAAIPFTIYLTCGIPLPPSSFPPFFSLYILEVGPIHLFV